MEGYMTFMWLTSKVFIDRDFVALIDRQGLDAVIASCPLGDDMSAGQKRSFMAAFKNWRLRLLVKIWWIVYDDLRRRGKIPAAASPWRP